MSFLTQNHVFYRCVLIARVCKEALKSGADDFQDGLENRSKIDEKSSQNGFGMRLFSSWFLASLLTPILDRFWSDFGSIFGAKIGPKSIKKASTKTMQKRRAFGCEQKSESRPLSPRGPAALTPGNGVGGRGKPFPEGEEGMKGSIHG